MRISAGSIAAWVAAAALAALTGPAPAQAPAVQGDAWVLGQAPENCYISRSIDADGQKAEVLIQSFGMTTPYHVVVRSPALPLLPQRAEVAQVRFGSALPSKDTYAILGKWNGVGTAVFAVSWHDVGQYGEIYYYQGAVAQTAATIDRSAQVLSLQVPNSGPLTFQLGDMTGAIDRLDACTRALEAKWSAAASAGATVATQPELLHPGEANWHMKYPNVALLNLISGMTEVRMTVDEKGRARDCVVQVSTWLPQFGEDSCEALKTVARFKPAHDAQGNPVKALFRASIIFINYHWS